MRTGRTTAGRIPWFELGLEAMLVVLSVLLALGLNSWRQRRSHEALARQALAAVRGEIEANREQINRRLTYHRALLDTLRADPDHRVVLRPALIQTDAWESAQATGAAAYVDFPTAVAVGRLYSLERHYDDLVRSTWQSVYTAAFLARDSRQPWRLGAVTWTPVLQDFVGFESALSGMYDSTLDRIGSAVPAGTDSVAGSR